ncbi:stimulated by retinoic acid gene 8 protein homolog [Tenrec ecaudatus]|uniref:stimulated by retinoic acid gene 8 protein homolog n=1 Tax=Tenrec ecaudatus TaxID=94439 RepID=UPI003F5A37B2
MGVLVSQWVRLKGQRFEATSSLLETDAAVGFRRLAVSDTHGAVLGSYGSRWAESAACSDGLNKHRSLSFYLQDTKMTAPGAPAPCRPKRGETGKGRRNSVALLGGPGGVLFKPQCHAQKDEDVASGTPIGQRPAFSLAVTRAGAPRLVPGAEARAGSPGDRRCPGCGPRAPSSDARAAAERAVTLQPVMETSAEGGDPRSREVPQPPAHLEEPETRVARRRLSQARHRATLTGLFNSLKKTVYAQSDLSASKWQVLNKAKSHIQELEQTLDTLLKLKDSFNLEDGNANTLEEVKEEYARKYSRNLSLDSLLAQQEDSWYLVEALKKDAEKREEGEEEAPEEEEEEEDEEEGEEDEEEGEEDEEEQEHMELTDSQGVLSPDLLEFERYLTFYKQTMDLLTSYGVISSWEAALPIVSAAISHLWQTLSEERKASLLQAWEQHSRLSGLPEACGEPTYTEGSMKDSGVDSQGASCSLVSTPEEILFEDAFDVANFLDKSEPRSTSSTSSLAASAPAEDTEEKFQLYLEILEFFQSLHWDTTQSKQEADLQMDQETVMLRCLETFDDEDL